MADRLARVFCRCFGHRWAWRGGHLDQPLWCDRCGWCVDDRGALD